MLDTIFGEKIDRVRIRRIDHVKTNANQKEAFKIEDYYNPKKIWIVIKTKSGAYMLQQNIDGKQYGKKERFSLQRIAEIVNLDKTQIQDLLR